MLQARWICGGQSQANQIDSLPFRGAFALLLNNTQQSVDRGFRYRRLLPQLTEPSLGRARGHEHDRTDNNAPKSVLPGKFLGAGKSMSIRLAFAQSASNRMLRFMA